MFRYLYAGFLAGGGRLSEEGVQPGGGGLCMCFLKAVRLPATPK